MTMQLRLHASATLGTWCNPLLLPQTWRTLQAVWLPCAPRMPNAAARTVLCSALLLIRSSARASSPLVDLFGQPGGDERKCSGAQIVRTNSSLLVWDICGAGAGVANRTVWLRRSTDWGVTWEEPVPQPQYLGALDLGQFVYNLKADAVLCLSSALTKNMPPTPPAGPMTARNALGQKLPPLGPSALPPSALSPPPPGLPTRCTAAADAAASASSLITTVPAYASAPASDASAQVCTTTAGTTPIAGASHSPPSSRPSPPQPSACDAATAAAASSYISAGEPDSLEGGGSNTFNLHGISPSLAVSPLLPPTSPPEVDTLPAAITSPHHRRLAQLQSAPRFVNASPSTLSVTYAAAAAFAARCLLGSTIAILPSRTATRYTRLRTPRLVLTSGLRSALLLLLPLHTSSTLMASDDTIASASYASRPAAPTPTAAGRLTTLNDMQRWDRFDILIKVAYARHFLAHGIPERAPPAGVPEGSHLAIVRPTPFTVAAYTEHERAMNNFFEKCFQPASQYFRPQHFSHPSCTPKQGPTSFLDSFHALLLSMRNGGYMHEGGPNSSSIPVCRTPRLYPINGAHRISAAIALGLSSVPMHVMATCPRPLLQWDWHFFSVRGYKASFLDWVVHEAIVANDDLHVLHIWPRAAASGGNDALAQVRSLTAQHCAVDGGILYEKTVPMSNETLRLYVDMAYGDVHWLVPQNYMSWNDSLSSRLVAFVVRSTPQQMTLCKAMIRRLYNVGTGHSWKAACHATDSHAEAILASQTLFNANSLEVLRRSGARGAEVCKRVATEVAKDLTLSGSRPTLVKRSHPVARPSFLIPESIAADTGTAMALLGLRPMTDIDLVSDSDSSVASSLLALCGQHRHRGKLSASTCQHSYGSHNPPTVWFQYHSRQLPEWLVRDPTVYAYCYGLKFIAPHQLLLYKRLRLAARHEEKDARDVALLKGFQGNRTCSKVMGKQVDSKTCAPYLSDSACLNSTVQFGMDATGRKGVFQSFCLHSVADVVCGGCTNVRMGPSPSQGHGAPVALATPATPATRAGNGRLLEGAKREHSHATHDTCALVTYLHDEKFLLQIWLRYYLRHIAGEDVFILDHFSQNTSYLEDAKAAHGVHVSRIATKHDTFFPLEAIMHAVQQKVHNLLEDIGYPCVLVAEMDEIVAPHPKLFPGGLGQFLSTFAADTGKNYPKTMLLQGMQLAHISDGRGREPPLNWSASIMAQRSYWGTDGHFNKPYLTKQKLRYEVGGHGATGHNGTRMEVNGSLYGLLKLIHLHHADRGHCEQRMAGKVADALKRGVNRADVIHLGPHLGWPQLQTAIMTKRMSATVNATKVDRNATERSSKWCGYAYSSIKSDGRAVAFVEYDTVSRHRWNVHTTLDKIDRHWKQVVI